MAGSHGEGAAHGRADGSAAEKQTSADELRRSSMRHKPSSPADIRTNFADTAFWAAALTTDG